MAPDVAILHLKYRFCRQSTHNCLKHLRGRPIPKATSTRSRRYELWRNRGAEFLTEPKEKYGETRCYIRDPDGYIIEVGESQPGVAYG